MTIEISVLIPSRGRPGNLLRAVSSLMINRKIPPNVEVLIALDDDDSTYTEAVELLGTLEIPGRQLSVVLGERHGTLAAVYNALAEKSQGKYLMAFADDYTLDDDAKWPNRIFNAAKGLVNGIGVMHLRDAGHQGFPSLPVIPRKVYETLGYFMPNGFPNWFGDTWWDEIATVFGQLIEVDLDVLMPEGKGLTHGLVEFEFWLGYFEATHPVRCRDAFILGEVAFGGKETAAFRAMLERLPQAQAFCYEKIKHLRNPELIKQVSAKMDHAPSDKYLQIKAAAEKHIAEIKKSIPRPLRVGIAIPSGRTWEAGTAVDVAGLLTYSARAGIDTAIINVQSSMITHSRNSTVQKALDTGCDFILWVDSDMKFPPDTLIRLLNHKKDIVGATYNKRVPPYETLGTFKNPQSVMEGGLQEALLLPGGLLLVKCDVYRKTQWPSYFETYHWQGETRLDGFKSLLKDYFTDVPPQEVLDSLDGTPLAEWINENYTLGHDGKEFLYFSEDLNFCRKVRKAGYQIWCDVDLTFQVVHLGTLEVTCKNPATLTDEERARYLPPETVKVQVAA